MSFNEANEKKLTQPKGSEGTRTKKRDAHVWKGNGNSNFFRNFAVSFVFSPGEDDGPPLDAKHGGSCGMVDRESNYITHPTQTNGLAGKEYTPRLEFGHTDQGGLNLWGEIYDFHESCSDKETGGESKIRDINVCIPIQ